MAIDETKAYFDECLSKNLKKIAKALVPHAQRVKLFDRNERAYKGIVDGVRAGRWNHQVFPPHIFNVIETIEAGLIDDATITKITPDKDSADESAEALEHLIRKQESKANFDEERGKFTKSSLVYGIGVMKTQWLHQRGPQTRRNWDETGHETDPVTEEITHFDGPISENVDPRNFFWDTSATSIDNAEYVCFRYYADKEFVRAKGEAEEGEDPLWMNVKEALDTRPTKDVEAGRSLDKSKPDVDYGCEYEIIEVWTRDRLVVICNQSVLVQDDPSPFWHGELPFQVGCTLTDLNRFEGQSEVTILIAIQNALWSLLNQTLDNVELANNGIVMFSDTVENTDAFQFFPGAKWVVENAQTDVKMWEPNTRVLNASQGITESLKSDMQSLAAALPYLAGSGGDQIDQKTATGISIISNMAQRRILRKKALLGYAYRRCGRQWVSLNQQFLTTPEAIRIEGPEGIQVKHVTPQEIQGSYDFSVESMTESLDRQQKRTEALNLLETFATVAPALPMFAAAGLNSKAFVERVLASFEVMNPDSFMQAIPPPMQPQMSPIAAALNGAQPPADPNAPYQAPAVAAQNPLTPAGG